MLIHKICIIIAIVATKSQRELTMAGLLMTIFTLISPKKSSTASMDDEDQLKARASSRSPVQNVRQNAKMIYEDHSPKHKNVTFNKKIYIKHYRKGSKLEKSHPWKNMFGKKSLKSRVPSAAESSFSPPALPIVPRHQKCTFI